MSNTFIPRSALLLALTLAAGGCELIGDIFQAGFVVGIIIVVLIIAVIAWLIRMFRRGAG
ncbi:MAG TPA: hypothetical protein VFZ69_14550 [Longimicrobiales bacterium]